MPTLALRILPAALLERDHLATALLRHDLGSDARTRDQRSTDFDGVPVAVAQHLIEGHFRAGLTGQRHDDDLVLGRDLVLFTARLDHCKHVRPRRQLYPMGGRLFVQH